MTKRDPLFPTTAQNAIIAEIIRDHVDAIRFQVAGRSMWPLLRPGDRATFVHCEGAKEGDVVLYQQDARSPHVAHRVIGRLPDDRLRLRGDFTLEEDRAISAAHLLGRLVGIERSDGRSVDLCALGPRLLARVLPPLQRKLPSGLNLFRFGIRILGRASGKLGRLVGRSSRSSPETSRLCARVLVDLLESGEPVEFTALGGSMAPAIRAGARVRVEPCDPSALAVGDFGAYESTKGYLIVHRVVRSLEEGHVVFRGDGLGCDDPPTPASRVLGIATVAMQPITLGPLRLDAWLAWTNRK